MLKRSYIYFWITGIVFLLYYIKYPNGHLNFDDYSFGHIKPQKHNLNNYNILFLITICFFFGIGISYWLIEKFKIKLRKKIIKTHVLITLGITWLNFILVFYSFYFPNKFKRLLYNSTFESITNILFFLIMLAQVLLFINIAYGIFEKKPAANHRL